PGTGRTSAPNEPPERAPTSAATRWCSSPIRARPPGPEPFLEHLGDVQHPDALAAALRLALLDGVVEHDHAVGAGRPDQVGPGGQGLVGALQVDPFADPLLHPHAGPAGAAAEAALPAAVHLDRADPGHGVKDRPGGPAGVVVAAQVAGVVVGDGGLDRPGGHQAALVDQAPQQLGVVDDLVVAAQVRVLAGQGVEAVGAGGDHLAGADAVEGLDVLLGLELVEVLVAEPPGRVAGAGLAGAEHGERHPGPVQQPGDRPGRLAGPVLERGRAADPVQVLDVVGDAVADHRDLEVEALGPGQALAGTEAPGVARVLDVAQHGAGLGREAGLHQDLVAAQLHDGVDVLDVDRALLDAGPAGGAGPQDVLTDHVGDQALLEHGGVVAVRLLQGGLAEQERGLLEQVVAQVGDDQLGRQRFAGVPGRALVLAAAALGAGGQVQQLLEVQVLDLAGAEDVLLGHLLGVDPGGGQRPQGLGAAGEGDV